MDMKFGTRYIVTKPSNDGTFDIGNHISLLRDGSILCIEAQGWIDAEYVAEATEGMEVKIDKKWLEKQKSKLQIMQQSFII